MKRLLMFVLLLTALRMYAQPTLAQRVEDSVVGWWYKSIVDKPKPFQYLGRDFSLKQQEHMNTVIEWMKKSYIPVAGIGTFKRIIYNDSYSFLPHSYGIDFRVWNVSLEKDWLDEKGLLKPIPEEYTKFYATANTIVGGQPISFVNTPTQYLFILAPDGFADGEQAYNKRINNQADPKIHPQVYKYLTWINKLHTVYLVPGNKLPVTPVTKGEYLSIADAAIDRDKNYPDRHERMHKAIRDLREKHKASLQEQAVLGHSQPAILDYEGFSDPFHIEENTRIFKHYYPVYKLEPAVLEKCKSDQPQWIAISFPYFTKENGNQHYELYTALTENFNYEYAYNYFFDPEKVKGIPYKPANEEQLKARLDNYRKRAYWKNPNEGKTLPAAVHFMDDFSSNTEGTRPLGWYFRSIGDHSKVSTLKNLPGKWVELGFANPLYPHTSLRKPLPQNFAIEFDAATDEFQSRTGGAVVLYLNTRPLGAYDVLLSSGNGATITLTLRAGNAADFNNNNYSGKADIRISTSPALNFDKNGNESDILSSYELREFTNKKNKISVKLTVNNGEVNLFIDNKQVLYSKQFKTTYGSDCSPCGVPSNSIFKTLYFDNRTTDWGVQGKSDGVDVYISNVKITVL